LEEEQRNRERSEK
jgi:hypothetical protein